VQQRAEATDVAGQHPQWPTDTAALVSAPLASYTELVGILQTLPLRARETRRARGMNLREAAGKIGLSFNTLSRFERGANDLQLSNAILVLQWLENPRNT